MVCDKYSNGQIDSCNCKGSVKIIATGISRIPIKAVLQENNRIMTQTVNVLSEKNNMCLNLFTFKNWVSNLISNMDKYA